MENPAQVRAATIARALAVKGVNAFTAAATGTALSITAALLFGIGSSELVPLVFVLGVGLGTIYANAFEYVLHRFFLHWGQGFLVQRHALHHNSSGAPDEARYINFATSPWVVVLLFVLNAVPVYAVLFMMERWLEAASPVGGSNIGKFGAVSFGVGMLGSGIFTGFTVYYILYEEIHWRIHLGGRLPRWLGFARRHHMLHHADFSGHYNVFLPLFDRLFTPVGVTRKPHPRA